MVYNDYFLINKLLEDGSEASLSKLKTIADLENLNLFRIEKSYCIQFISLFGEYYAKNKIDYNTMSYIIPERQMSKFFNSFNDCCLNCKKPILKINNSKRKICLNEI